MKNLIYLFCLLLTISTSCKKDQQPASYASIMVINASYEAGAVKVNYQGKPIQWSTLTGNIGIIPTSSSQTFTLFNLNNEYPFTIVSSSDTLKKIFTQRLEIESRGMYTLFITGKNNAYDSIFLREQSTPYNLPDSAIAIRFINLSNASKINISRSISPTIYENAGLSFKQISDYKYYPLKKIIPIGSLSFEIRDASSNALLTTYTLPNSPSTSYPTVSTSLSRFKSLTLIINNILDAKTGIMNYSIFPAPNYN